MDGLDVLLGPPQAEKNGLDVLMSGAVSAPTQAPTYSGPPLTRTDRFMKGLNDVSAAGAQLLTHALPDKAVNAVNDATAYVNNLPVVGPLTQMLGMVPATAKSLDTDIARGEQQYQQARQQGAQGLSNLITGKQADPGVDWMRMGGNVVGTLPLAAALPAATGLGSAAAQGAVFGALSQPVTSGDFTSEKAKQVGLGAATGGVTNLAIRGIASALAPKIAPEVKTLMDAGITPTPGQILGGGASRVEQAATSVPVLGDMIRNAQRRSLDQFNTAAINRSLEPIGEKLPKDVAGREAIEYAGTKLGQAYDSVLSRIGAVKVPNQLVDDLANLQGMTQTLPKAQSEQFGRILDKEILGRIDAKGMMTGEGIKAAESNLGNLAKGYGRSPDFDSRQLADALREAQASVRGMLAQVKPDLAPELSAINKGYANLLRTERAASYVGSDGGVFTAAQLQSAVKALDPSKNHRQFAQGNALMQDLSEAGKNVLGSSVPDSGTPFRHAVQVGGAALLGHNMLPESMASAALPAAAGLGLLSMPYTRLGQNAAAALLTKRPDMARTLAGGLLGAAPALPLLSVAAENGR
jgi:hypothetical protein